MNTFGDFLKYLRELQGLTISELSELIGYSRRQIIRCEQNNQKPSLHLISTLSKEFNVNIGAYNEILINFSSFNSYTTFIKIRTLIEEKNIGGLDELVSIAEITEEFKEGEAFQLLSYAKALLVIHKDLNDNEHIKEAEKICIDCLKKTYCGFSIDNIPSRLLTETSYSIITFIAYTLFSLKELEKAKKLLSNTIDNLNKHYYNIDIPVNNNSKIIYRAYIVMHNNLADIYVNEGSYEKALELCNNAIDFLIKSYQLFGLSNLYELKYQCLYKLGNIDEAKKFYKFSVVQCEMTETHSYLERIKKRAKQDYPLVVGSLI